MTRAAMPAAIVLATLSLLGYASADWLWPATEVEVARATALAGQADAAEAGGSPSAAPAATVVAQAPGWVEPDPYPIYVTALADGVVERIDVLEGETVQAGQTLVQLVDDDAKLASARARAELARREAAWAAAQTDYREPVALERSAAVAEARLAEAEAALVRLEAEIAQEAARLDELAATYERLAGLDGRSVSALQVEAARFRMQSQRAAVEATRQRRPQLEAVVDAAEAELAAAKRDLALKSQLRRARDEAAAAVDAARTAVAEAELRLQRMTITSPRDGVVMERLVAPGAKLMLNMDGMHSAHAIHLYDPESLQVRVDVPLADAEAVGVGQRAEVVVDVLPDVAFVGVVTRAVHQADIAKNTVQFKVAIEEPSPLLKPEMLARVKFLGRAAPGSGAQSRGEASAGAGGAPVAVSQSAVVVPADGDPFVWWVSPTDNRLRRRSVTLGQRRGEGLVEIRAGLNPGDAVVDRPEPSLTEGQRVRFRSANRWADETAR
jgi:RND family efflux transporter MFP subunit